MSKLKDDLCLELYNTINGNIQGIEDKPFNEEEFNQLELVFKLSTLSPYFGKWLEKNKDFYIKRIKTAKKM